MIDVPRNLLSRVKSGESPELLENYIMNSYPMPVIIKAFAELIVTADDAVNKPQILVTEEELQAINSLFRVKGMRVNESGEVVRETRGRPRKISSPFDTVVDDNPTLI
jgi:hypothetical protein